MQRLSPMDHVVQVVLWLALGVSLMSLIGTVCVGMIVGQVIQSAGAYGDTFFVEVDVPAVMLTLAVFALSTTAIVKRRKRRA